MNENNTRTINFCPDCGTAIDHESSACKECGFPIEKQKAETAIAAKKTRIPAKPLGIALCVVAVICFIVGITRITNDKYTFWSEHYQECMDGYEDCKSEARTAGPLFKDSYQNLAESWKDMADRSLEKIWKYRIEAIVLCSFGVVFVIFGIMQLKRNEENANGAH